jgi:ADP-heptose:LPS heptosyltransferase
MRKLDYWLGSIVCFILSIDYSLKRFLRLAKLNPNDSPQKILFIELSEMGSSIIAYEAMKKAQRLFPKAELYFLIFEERKESVSIINIIPTKNILTIRIRHSFLFLIDTIKIIWLMRRKGIDTTVDFELFTRFSAIISYLGGAKRRVGFYRFHTEGLYRGNFLTHKVIYSPYHHTSLNFMSLVLSLRAPAEETPFLKKYLDQTKIKGKKIIADQKTKKILRKKLAAFNPQISQAQKLIIIDPNFSVFIPTRSWPIENYIKLGQKILQIPGTFIIITGDKKSEENTTRLYQALNSARCLNLSDKTTFAQLIDLYSVCDVFVTHDSGPAHFAALTSIKSIVLYGPGSPVTYGPLNHNCRVIYSNFACSPCVLAFNQRYTDCKDNKCMQAIKVEQVFQEVKKALS